MKRDHCSLRHRLSIEIGHVTLNAVAVVDDNRCSIAGDAHAEAIKGCADDQLRRFIHGTGLLESAQSLQFAHSCLGRNAKLLLIAFSSVDRQTNHGQRLV